MATDSTAPLREDVRLLGELLGTTIREQVGKTVFDRVEAIRGLAKSARQHDENAAGELTELLAGLPTEDLIPVSRAFSHFLNLANIAEQHHRIRRRRAYQRRSEARPQKGSLDELFPRLLQAGVSTEKIIEKLSSQRVELVLTAHPTEVSRRTLIRKYFDMSDCLGVLDRTDLTPGERKQQMGKLKRLIISAWHTDELRRTRPTPVDEAKWGFAVIEQTLWQAVPRFLRELDESMRSGLGKRLPLDVVPVQFASWMGGDRDGNPNVTHAVTREVCLLSRWAAAELYEKDIEKLRAELSMNDCNEALRAIVGDHPEPYRELLRRVYNQCRQTQLWAEAAIQGREIKLDAELLVDSQQLLEPLKLMRRSLIDCNMQPIADGEITDLIRRVRCFGVSLLRLDIRQESTRHAQVIDAITQALGLGSYLEWSEDFRQTFLLTELQNKRPLIPRDLECSDEVREVLDTFRVIAQQPVSLLGAYVISMASAPSDILAVMLLQREMGVSKPMRVVPLFETLDDLQGAAATIGQLMRHEWYVNAIESQQEIMIGYSDSAKDAGFIAAAWAQFRAQEQLSDVCQQFGVKLTLFHGRGGSVSRGGGSAHAALLSQPPGTVDGSVRVTEQGEMIRFKFGLEGVAVRTLELYTSATLEATLLPPPAPDASWRDIMEQLAKTSLGAYRSTIRGNPRFLEYFHSTTPEGELQRLMIGSRPSKRKAKNDISALRAIPWVFAWTQIRLMLPAWLGVGEALAEAFEEEKGEVLAHMMQSWPFFRALMDMLEMVLAKADPDIVQFYERKLSAPELAEIGHELRSKLARVIELVKQVSGHDILLEDNPVMRRSIDVRNPYADPLHMLEAELMCRSRACEGESSEIERALLLTIAGIAAGMRNTG